MVLGGAMRGYEFERDFQGSLEILRQMDNADISVDISFPLLSSHSGVALHVAVDHLIERECCTDHN